jgi:hypothetical protein
MEERIYLVEIIDSIGDIYSASMPIDKSQELFKDIGVRMFTASGFARAWTKAEKDSDLLKAGSFVKEGALYFPRENKVVLLRDSLVLRDPVSAVKAYRGKIKYYVRNAHEELERTFSDDIFVVDNYKVMPSKELGNSGIGNWLFGPNADYYGCWLDYAGIKRFKPIFYQDLATYCMPFATQLWMAKELDKCGSIFGNIPLDQVLCTFGYREGDDFGNEEEFSPAPEADLVFTRRQS